METNTWIYILVMAAVTYGIRALPLTLIRKEIKKYRYPLLPLLCPLCNPGGHDFSGHSHRHPVGGSPEPWDWQRR